MTELELIKEELYLKWLGREILHFEKIILVDIKYLNELRSKQSAAASKGIEINFLVGGYYD